MDCEFIACSKSGSLTTCGLGACHMLLIWEINVPFPVAVKS